MAKTIKFYLITLVLLCFNQNTFAAAAAGEGRFIDEAGVPRSATAAGAGVPELFELTEEQRAAAAAAAFSGERRFSKTSIAIITVYESKIARRKGDEFVPLYYPIHEVSEWMPLHHGEMYVLSDRLTNAFKEGSTATSAEQKLAMIDVSNRLGILADVWGDPRLSLQKYTLGMLKEQIHHFCSKAEESATLSSDVIDAMRGYAEEIKRAANFFPVGRDVYSRFNKEDYMFQMRQLFKEVPLRKYRNLAQDGVIVETYGFV